jgi:uncharacterized protein DUF4157
MADHEQAEREFLPSRKSQPAPPEQEQSPVERLASNIGNRNFGQVMARFAEGEAIMPNGTVHPDAQALIAARAGTGSRLDRSTLGHLEKTHGDLSDARVHTGAEADMLARAVNAVAFTVGSDIYFRNGAYNPHSNEGRDLIAHETAHVVQQRGAPAAGPLQVSNPGDKLERDADRIASGADVA